MPSCETIQAQLLSHLYGLLDEEDEKALREHLEACASCQQARTAWESQRLLLAEAARGEFPEVSFRAPSASGPVVEAIAEPRTIMLVRKTRPGRPRWGRWVVAAAALLCVGVVGAWTWANGTSMRREADQVRDQRAERIQERERLEREGVERAKRKQEGIQAIQDEIQRLSNEQKKQDLEVGITLPVSAQAGGYTEAEITTQNGLKAPVAAEVDVEVREAKSGRVVYTKKGLKSEKGKCSVVYPPLPAKPKTQYAMFLAARRLDNGARVEVAGARLPLIQPLYLTHLTTDKPMYQPGEVVSFRSLTLERFSLTPVIKPVFLSFRINSPSGATVFSVQGNDQLRMPDRGFNIVAGPDKKPVRGVGTGSFAIPPDAPGGVYTLTVAVTVTDDAGKPALIQEQSRSFVVNKYEKPRLTKELEFTRKSYGPGEEVVAACRVAKVEGGKPLANQEVKATVRVDGKVYDAAGNPAKGQDSGIVLRTDSQGNVNVRIKLPARIDVGDASLAVAFTDGASHETIVRPIPVIVKKLRVEFYPEGGDLVAGAGNRLYFQARTPLGKPAEMKGRIVDGAGQLVAAVATLSDDKEPGVNQGMGVVRMPDLVAGAAYELKIDSPPGIEGRFPLPQVKADGVVLSIPTAAITDSIPVTLRNGTQDRELFVGAYCRGRLLDSKSASLKKGESQRIDLKPGEEVGGVYRITVFERLEAGGKQLKPVAERLVYRSATRKLALTVRSDKKDYSPGERVKLTLEAANEKAQPAPVIMLVSVVDSRVITMADEKTARSMPTQFLLMTEVRDPEDLEHADFLLGEGPLAAQALDLLLGTQGWRRFAEQKPVDELKKVHKEAATRLAQLSGQERRGRGVFVQPEAANKNNHQAEIQKLSVQMAGLQIADPKTAQEHWQKLNASERAIAEAERSVRRADARVSAYWESVRLATLFTLAGLLAFGAIGIMVVGLVRVSYYRAWAAPYLASGATALVFCVVVVGAAISQMGGAKEKARELASESEARRNLDLGMAMPMNAPGGDMRKWAERAPPPPMPAQFDDNDKLGMAPGPNEGIVFDGAKVRLGDAAALPPMAALGVPPMAPLAKALKREQLMEQKDARRKMLPDLARVQQRIFGRRALDDRKEINPAFMVREYAHVHQTTKDNLRTDFAETLYWQPVLVLPDGKGEVSFDLCDSVTAFRVLAYAHTLDGRLGAVTASVKSRLPFTLEPKVPLEVTASDKITVPLSIANATDLARSVKIQASATGLQLQGPANVELSVGPDARARKLFTFTPSIVEGPASLLFQGQCAPFAEDRILRQLNVVPDGFTLGGFHSEQLEASDRFTITLPATWLKGTLKVQAQVYPSTLADLQKGLESLLREPNGCFEQTSTSNYPNVLILDYLKENDKTNPEVIRRVRQLLDSGYAKLTQYECDAAERKKKGYEWFGGSAPPHEALTAYGLLQFRDMARVYPVDKAMVERTRQYLMGQKDGKGGFNRNARALDTFGGAPPHITNAYIVWALTESGPDDDVTAELAALVGQAKTSKDPYFLALVANSLLNRSKTDEAKAILHALTEAQKDDGHLDGAETSITRSGGRDLQIEATALTVLAWLKANHPEYAPHVRKAVEWIGKQRGGYGGFGSTQSTILALKALIAHTRANKKTANAGELVLTVNGKVVDRKAFPAGAQDALIVTVPNADQILKAGANVVEVQITGKNAFPYTLGWSYRSLKPANGPKCPVQLSTRFDRNDVQEADTVRLTTTVENKSGQDQGMTVAILGLPGGVTLPEDMKQIKTYVRPRGKEGKKGDVSRYLSYFEIRGRDLVLYWRDLAKDEKIEIGLDLICRVPGEYRGPASRAYLYYNADDKFWTEPLQVRIKAKGEN